STFQVAVTTAPAGRAARPSPTPHTTNGQRNTFTEDPPMTESDGQRARMWTSVDEVPLTTRFAGDLVREIGLYSCARWVWLCGWSLSSALCGRSRTSLPSSATPSSAG